jgi:tripartite ATP-independent transporter DctP family solute receptor
MKAPTSRASRRRFALAAAAALALPSATRAAQLLRFAHTDTPNGTRQEAAEFFAQRVRELSGGELSVAVFHSGQWGSDPQNIERLMAGTLDFTVSATGSYAGLNKSLDLAMLPYLVQTYEQGWALYDGSEWFRQQFARLPARGVRILSSFEAGFRSFTTKGPMSSPEAAVGKTMRTFKNAMMEATLSAFGFLPKVMPVTEVDLAIQRGEVFGQENPVDTIASQRFHEVAPHVTLTQHVYSPVPLAVSEKRWAVWSEPQRRAVQKAAQEASRFSRERVVKDEQRQLALFAEQGAKVVRPDLEPWQRAVASVHEAARRRYGAEADALIAQARAIRERR